MKLPPPHRKTESSANTITITIAPLPLLRRTNRRVANRPTRHILPTHLTANQFPPFTIGTKNQSLTPCRQAQPHGNTDGSTIAPPWPPDRVNSVGYVPELSAHDRGFMRPRPTRIEGEAGRYGVTRREKRTSGTQLWIIEFITVRINRRRGAS